MWIYKGQFIACCLFLMSATTEIVFSPTHQQSGELHLILGSMFSGKSAALYIFGKRFISIGKKVMVINHIINVRDNDGNDSIISRDGIRIEGHITTDALIPILDTSEYEAADVILIEEGQFFGDDIIYFVKKAIDYDKKIVAVAGLDGNAQRSEFGHILKLIPLADSFKKLYAFCKECGDGTLAPFTRKLDNAQTENGQVDIGSEDKYEPLCRKHYIERNINIENQY